jgi:hypothetical protein
VFTWCIVKNCLCLPCFLPLIVALIHPEWYGQSAKVHIQTSAHFHVTISHGALFFRLSVGKTILSYYG